MKESHIAEAAREYLGAGTVKSSRDLAVAICRCGELLDLWPLGGLTLSHLRRLSTKAVRKECYRTFSIPKRAGGTRQIAAPTGRLRDIQRAINLLLQARVRVMECATGFVCGRSVTDNALPHIGSHVVVNLDIENFFPSVTKRMVRESLKLETREWLESHESVNMLCSLVSMPDGEKSEVLPQGAPSSPMISNIVLGRLDRRLAGFARERGYAYTRYADDLTLSGREIRNMSASDMKLIERIVAEEGFKLNRRKIKQQGAGHRQSVTGLTVNERINVSRDFVKNLRVCLHLWETRGYEEASGIYRRDFRGGEDVDFARAIKGKINYIAMVKGRRDPVFMAFSRRLRLLTGRK